MQIDRPVVTRLPQRGDEALALAEAINADLVGALGKIPQRCKELLSLAQCRLMAVNRQAKGCLGDKEIAGHQFEGGTGGIGVPLVVA